MQMQVIAGWRRSCSSFMVRLPNDDAVAETSSKAMASLKLSPADIEIVLHVQKGLSSQA